MSQRQSVSPCIMSRKRPSKSKDTEGRDWDDEPLDFADLVPGTSLKYFSETVWGKTELVSMVEEETLFYLKDGFCDGDLAELAARCRKDDNSKFTSDEIAGEDPFLFWS